MVGENCKVSFDVPNTLASVLDSKQSIVYDAGRHASENLVNIECKLNSGTLQQYSFFVHNFYNFFPNAAPGQKILEALHNLIYLPVTVHVISTLSVWLADQREELLDLRGEELTIRIQLRER